MFLRDLWRWGKRSMDHEIDVIKQRVKKLSQYNIVSNAVNNFVEKTATVIYDSVCQILFSSESSSEEKSSEEKPDKLQLYINNMKFFAGSFFAFQCFIFSTAISMQKKYFQECTNNPISFAFFLSIIISLFCSYIVDVLVRNKFLTRLIIALIKCWNHKNLFNRFHVAVNTVLFGIFLVNTMFMPMFEQVHNEPIDPRNVVYFLASTIVVFLDFFYKNKFIKIQEVENYLPEPSSNTEIVLEVKRIAVVTFAIIISLSDILSDLKSTFLITAAFYFVALYTFRSIIHRIDQNQILTWLQWLIVHQFIKDPDFDWAEDGVEPFLNTVKQLIDLCQAFCQAEGDPIDVQIAKLGSAIQGQKHIIKQSVFIVICTIERLIELTHIPDNMSLTVQRSTQIIKVVNVFGEEVEPTPEDIMELNNSPVLRTSVEPDRCIKTVKNSRYIDPVDNDCAILWGYGKAICNVFVGGSAISSKPVLNPTIKFSIKNKMVSSKVRSLVEYAVPGIIGLMEYKIYLEAASTVDNIWNSENLTKLFELVKKRILSANDCNNHNDREDLLKNETE